MEGVKKITKARAYSISLYRLSDFAFIHLGDFNYSRIKIPFGKVNMKKRKTEFLSFLILRSYIQKHFNYSRINRVREGRVSAKT